jgi:O-antigen ligase
VKVLSISVLAASLAWLVFRTAGVEVVDFCAVVAVIGGLATAYALFGFRKGESAGLPKVTVILLGAALLIVLLQMAPLPVGWISVLSPHRAEHLAALATVAGHASWATLTNNLSLTMQRWLQLLGFGLTLLLVRELTVRFRDRLWVVVAPLLAVSGVQAALGLLQHFAGGPGEASRGSYANRNHFAGLLEMSIPFAVMYAVAVLRRRRHRHSAPAGPAVAASGLLGLAAVMLVAVVWSLSRMGFLAALAGLLITGVLSTGSGMAGLRRWGAVAAAGVLIVLGLIYLPTDELIARYANIAGTESLTSDDRPKIWAGTRQLIGDYPVIGCGFGAFEPTFGQYQRIAPLLTVNFAHNDYLQFLAELGAAGFAAALALLLWITAGAFQGGTRASDGERRYLALACCGSLAALMLHSFVDFNIYVPANAMLAGWVGGVAEGLRELGWSGGRRR